jgi:hypothetical protein
MRAYARQRRAWKGVGVKAGESRGGDAYEGENSKKLVQGSFLQGIVSLAFNRLVEDALTCVKG